MRKDIQLLRGLAVILVILYHFGAPGFHNGFIGVDVFFVISGYLMFQLYGKGSIKEFYLRRFKRLVPAYLVVLTITLGIALFIISPADFQQTRN